jgi:hypothetical protein
MLEDFVCFEQLHQMCLSKIFVLYTNIIMQSIRNIFCVPHLSGATINIISMSFSVRPNVRTDNNHVLWILNAVFKVVIQVMKLRKRKRTHKELEI